MYFSPSSDIFQPVPEVLELTHTILEFLLSKNIGIAFLTKGKIPDKTLALLLHHADIVRAQIGIITHDDSIRNIFEPNAASIDVRLCQMSKMAAGDIAVEAAKPFLGALGFSLIAAAALLSTGSAINATLYGTARVSYVIAKEGELPKQLDRMVWRRPIEGLLITSVLTLLIANLFDLTNISIMGSSGFLIIFAGVNFANVRLAKKTGANRWISMVGCGLCLLALIILIVQRAMIVPNELWVLLVMVGAAFVIEVIYRMRTKRNIKSTIRK